MPVTFFQASSIKSKRYNCQMSSDSVDIHNCIEHQHVSCGFSAFLVISLCSFAAHSRRLHGEQFNQFGISLDKADGPFTEQPRRTDSHITIRPGTFVRFHYKATCRFCNKVCMFDFWGFGLDKDSRHIIFIQDCAPSQVGSTLTRSFAQKLVFD